MIYSYYLSLGSNIDPKILYLKKAFNRLKNIGEIKKKSCIYLTESWGEKDQPDFLNVMIKFKTRLSPVELLVEIKNIEAEIGRKKTYRWGPREIDVDIIFCKGVTINKNNLRIPHKEFSKRLFILKLMAELDRNYRVEGTGKAIDYFLKHCPDKSKIEKMDLLW
jgi:2-amino-4-hydroxy-6-hydroxymethyldihydropteridine diphosphokinase